MTAPKSNRLWRGLVIMAIFGLAGTIAFASSPGWAIQDYDGYLHFAAFAVITLLAVTAYPKVALSHIAVGVAILGGTTELLQFVPGVNRQPSWADFFFNLLGAASMLTFAALLRSRSRR